MATRFILLGKAKERHLFYIIFVFFLKEHRADVKTTDVSNMSWHFALVGLKSDSWWLKEPLKLWKVPEMIDALQASLSKWFPDISWVYPRPARLELTLAQLIALLVSYSCCFLAFFQSSGFDYQNKGCDCSLIWQATIFLTIFP